MKLGDVMVWAILATARDTSLRNTYPEYSAPSLRKQTRENNTKTEQANEKKTNGGTLTERTGRPYYQDDHSRYSPPWTVRDTDVTSGFR